MERNREAFIRWKLLVVLLGGMFLLRWINPATLAVVQGASMEPTLRDGQLFIIDRVRYRQLPVARGDVIAFWHENEVYVKRVVGVPGDVIDLLVNPYTGEAIPASPVMARRLRQSGVRYYGLLRVEHRWVPPGHVFVMGDHRAVSYDSRDFGPVPLQAILGRAWFLPSQKR